MQLVQLSFQEEPMHCGLGLSCGSLHCIVKGMLMRVCHQLHIAVLCTLTCLGVLVAETCSDVRHKIPVRLFEPKPAMLCATMSLCAFCCDIQCCRGAVYLRRGNHMDTSPGGPLFEPGTSTAQATAADFSDLSGHWAGSLQAVLDCLDWLSW